MLQLEQGAKRLVATAFRLKDGCEWISSSTRPNLSVATAFRLKDGCEVHESDSVD